MANNQTPGGNDFDKISQENIENLVKFESVFNDVNDIVRQYAKNLEGSYSTVNNIKNTLTDVNNTIRDAQQLQTKLGSEYIREQNILDRISNIRDKNKLSNEKINQTLAKSNGLYDLQVSTIRQLIEDGQNQQEIQEKISELIREESSDLELALATELQRLATNKQLEGSFENMKLLLKEANDRADRFNAKSAGLGRILKSIADIPVLGALANWTRIGDAFLESSKKGGNLSKGLAEMKNQFKILWEDPFVKALVGGYIFVKIYDIFKSYVQVIAEVDKGITSLSNNLGVSKEAGAAVYDTFGHISWDTIWGNKGMIAGLDKSYMSIRNMLGATTELQDSLGSNAMMTENRIQNEILLTKQMKFTTEEAANFQRLSLVSGKSADNILQSTIKQNKEGLSYRKILRDVANISSEISMRYANDPEAIAKAVVQANKLGMSLEQTKKISDSLLNFEQSIEGELESELLLGKQLNYEHARELALQGKTAEAAGEILRQVGGVAALDKMNVIQRERLAASIGMSAEELSKAAIQEEVIKKLNFENVDALKERVKTLQDHNDLAGIATLKAEAAKVQGGEVLLQDIAKASMAEKYEETMNKLKDILGNVLAHSTAIKIAFVSLTALAAAFAASMMASAVAALVLSGGTLAIGAAIGAGVLTAAAGGAAMYAVSDSVTSPGGNTISMPKGTLLPDKNDYVYTSTNPLPTGGGNNDNIVASKMDELIYHVKKGGNVYIDSTKSGTAYGMSYNSYA